MAAAILTQGKTSIRDSLKTLFTHFGISTDNTAFDVAQTRIDPSAAGTNIIKAASTADVDASTFDLSATITSADGTGSFFTVSAMVGAAATDASSRSVRTNAIGIDSGDTYTPSLRIQVQDNS